jgi:hypothetical protein
MEGPLPPKKVGLTGVLIIFANIMTNAIDPSATTITHARLMEGPLPPKKVGLIKSVCQMASEAVAYWVAHTTTTMIQQRTCAEPVVWRIRTTLPPDAHIRMFHRPLRLLGMGSP